MLDFTAFRLNQYRDIHLKRSNHTIFGLTWQSEGIFTSFASFEI